MMMILAKATINYKTEESSGKVGRDARNMRSGREDDL